MNNIIKTGKIWPVGIILFFMVVFTVNGLFLYLAIDNRPAPVTDTPYRDSLVFQKKIDSRALAKSAFKHKIQGLCSTSSCDIFLVLTPLSDSPSPRSVKLRMQRVSRKSEILEVESMMTKKEEYVFSSPKIIPGTWIVEAEFIYDNKQAWFREKVILRN